MYFDTNPCNEQEPNLAGPTINCGDSVEPNQKKNTAKQNKHNFLGGRGRLCALVRNYKDLSRPGPGSQTWESKVPIWFQGAEQVALRTICLWIQAAPMFDNKASILFMSHQIKLFCFRTRIKYKVARRSNWPKCVFVKHLWSCLMCMAVGCQHCPGKTLISGQDHRFRGKMQNFGIFYKINNVLVFVFVPESGLRESGTQR